MYKIIFIKIDSKTDKLPFIGFPTNWKLSENERKRASVYTFHFLFRMNEIVDHQIFRSVRAEVTNRFLYYSGVNDGDSLYIC